MYKILLTVLLTSCVVSHKVTMRFIKYKRDAGFLYIPCRLPHTFTFHQVDTLYIDTLCFREIDSISVPSKYGYRAP